MLYWHEQLYIHIYIQKHIQHNKEERTQFFRKIYLSHFIRERVAKGLILVMCERNILTPTLLAITAFLSCLPEQLNRGPGDPASVGTWFSFQHHLSNSTELPVAGVI